MLAIETAVNQYLALDPEMLVQLAKFSGKIIKLEILGINKALYLFPDSNGIQIRDEYDGDVDTVLRGSPISLFKMGVVSNAADLLLKGEVEISGDTRLGHQFKNVFSQMDIDWGEPLAKLFGDSFAYQIQQTGTKLGRWGINSIQSLSMSVSEYLQEESRDVVTETELEMFNVAVDNVRNDVDRLQAKIDLVLKQASKTKSE